MKILMVNKFLYENGGSETYMLKLGAYLLDKGHTVEYFGMENEKRCVGNSSNLYTSNIDFHEATKMQKITYAFKTIYSSEARKKIKKILSNFSPDVVHLNNFNYQLTPSIILEIVKWKKKTGKQCKIIYTAHDFQLVCPNHMMNNPITHSNCEKCLDNHYINCMRDKCIHGSFVRSTIGALESITWKQIGVYKHIDTIICCSEFMKKKLDTNQLYAGKTIALHNFAQEKKRRNVHKGEYAIYFGRYSIEKGVRTLLQACKELPEISFVFVGDGPLKEEMRNIPNVIDLGFLRGEILEKTVREAKFSICPSECYDNCPFSVIESQMYSTPVIGANIGGIPELINVGETGELFESSNKESLKQKIFDLWIDKEKNEKYQNKCNEVDFDSISTYYDKLMKIYQ